LSHGQAPAPTRIVLVGFMAAGKTVVGRVLARRLGWDFVDLDDAITGRTGRSPGAIIREDGEAAFRSLEAEMTEEVAHRQQVVLAPGGGWVTRPDLTASLGEGTVRVWLRVSPGEAVRRAEADATDRPLLGVPGERVDRAARLLRERERYYRHAELDVDTDELSPEVVAGEILRKLGLAPGGR
jgi:shikimate kinase